MARILLVEDDIDIRPLLEHVITADGHQVVAIESVGNGVALLRTQPFDLVIVDANLPDGSGLRVADAARQAGVRALVITGYGLSLPSGSLHSYDYLLKPIRPAELIAAIKSRLPREGSVVPFPKP